ncbi:MAG: sigma-70 family RNA polymerase sigma factor [Gemmatimonadaceae bacterium]|nr:sigma-70 family RNA polymerase sigma factor [Chitinophagaceae bacterium]
MEERCGVQMNDNAIIRLIQNGDVDAFAQLVQKYHKNLLTFIYRFVRDPHLSEDIGQEVFLDVYKSLSKFDPEMGTPFSAWIYICARNRCISELRKRGRSESVPLEDYHLITGAADGAEETLIRHEGRLALAASLEQLPEPFRTSMLKSLKGASLAEIACQCGISQATVKSRLFRAKEKMKQLMKEYVGGVVHERRI